MSDASPAREPLQEFTPSASLPKGTATPVDHVDRCMLAVTRKEWGFNNVPTCEFVVRGSIDPNDCRTALRDLMCRYPTCRATVHPMNPKRDPSLSLHYVVHDEYDVDALFTHLDMRGQPSEQVEDKRQEIRDDYLDPYTRFPFHLTQIDVSPTECRLLFQFHHMVMDARGFFGLTADFARFLEHARQGTRPPAEQLEPFGRVDQLEALGISRLRAVLWAVQALGLWARTGLQMLLKPTGASYLDGREDWVGHQGTVYRVYDAKLLEEWRPLRERHGFTTTTVLGGALVLADRRWNLELGVQPGWTRLGVAVETRPADPEFRSFANHLSAIMGLVQMREEPDPLELMRTLNRQFAREINGKQNKKRFVIERALTNLAPFENIRDVFLKGNGNIKVGISNIIPIPLPTLEGRGWRGEEVYITTPPPPPGLALSIVRYNGRLWFSYNYKSSVVSRELVERLADHVDTALGEMREALAR